MFPHISELLAHRGSMLLLEHVLSASPDCIRAQAKVDGDAWYADAQGAMPAWIGIELMAQAIAALVGINARARGFPPKQGLLLGTRSFTAHTATFARNETLLVTANEVFQDASGLAAFAGRIELAGATVVEATLKVYQPADFKSILEQGTQWN